MLLHAEVIRKRFFVDSFTQFFYTKTLFLQKLLPTEISHSHLNMSAFYIEMLLRTNTFKHWFPFKPRLSHTETYTHRSFSRKHFFTQTFLHTISFTYRSSYTQRLWHIDALYPDAFIFKHFQTQVLSHTETLPRIFTYRNFHTQTFKHKNY